MGKPNVAGLPKIKLQGSGGFRPPPSKQLDRTCQPGEIVHWEAIGGEKFIGELKEWDSNVAVVDIGGSFKAVEC